MNSLWNIKEIVRIFKNSVKLIYNIIPRDTSFLPYLFLHDVLYLFCECQYVSWLNWHCTEYAVAILLLKILKHYPSWWKLFINIICNGCWMLCHNFLNHFLSVVLNVLCRVFLLPMPSGWASLCISLCAYFRLFPVGRSCWVDWESFCFREGYRLNGADYRAGPLATELQVSAGPL